jgi:hypothetical protein
VKNIAFLTNSKCPIVPLLMFVIVFGEGKRIADMIKNNDTK